jgi:DNA replication protein DnaC
MDVAPEKLTREELETMLVDHNLTMTHYDHLRTINEEYFVPPPVGQVRRHDVDYPPGIYLERRGMGVMRGPFETENEALAAAVDLIAIEKAEDEAERERAVRYRNADAERRLERARATLPFPGKDLDSFTPKTALLADALETARRFAADLYYVKNGEGLMFCGPAGAGKTRLACALSESLAVEGCEVCYATVAQAMRANYNSNADLLVLDDVAVQDLDNPSEAQLAVLVAREVEPLLKKRLDDGRATLVIADCNVRTLEQYFGNAMFERLRARAWKIVEF